MTTLLWSLLVFITITSITSGDVSEIENETIQWWNQIIKSTGQAKELPPFVVTSIRLGQMSKQNGEATGQTTTPQAYLKTASDSWTKSIPPKTTTDGTTKITEGTTTTTEGTTKPTALLHSTPPITPPTTPPPTPPTTPPFTTPTTPPFTTPTTPGPVTLPPVEDVAKMARFVVHFSSWGSIAYSATQSPIEDYPSARVWSTSDGNLYSGTGIPYFMVSPLDLTYQALQNNNKCSLIVSLSQTSYCQSKSWDPEDPRCVQVILTGHFKELDQDSEEMLFARRVLWDRHPPMIDWYVNKKDHDWRFGKLVIEFITVLDTFGGRKYPDLAAYFSAEIPKPYEVQLV